MEYGLMILPKDKTLIGISYEECNIQFKGEQKQFYQIGIGVGLLVLYLIFHKKGNK